MFEKINTDYHYEIPMEDFEKLIEYERTFPYRNDDNAYRVFLFELLTDEFPGLGRIEYDGHFGNSIYFCIHVEEDTENFRAKVKKAIDDHITKAKKYLDAK